MTSASELFNNRRFRFGRSPFEVGTFDSSSGAGAGDGLSSHHNRRRNSHHNHGARRRHHDVDGWDLPRRTDIHISRRASMERYDIGGGSSSSQSIPANIDLETFVNIPIRERFLRGDRLPGEVLLARERLVERLRGIQLTGRRQDFTADIGDSRGNMRAAHLNLHRNRRDIDEWHMVTGLDPPTRSNPDVGSFSASVATRSHPPGLTQDDLDDLHIEVFSTAEKCDEENISRASLECSICLENFVEGTELVCLPCGHKYHQCCLYPWVRVCGDCPYCRAAIIVTDSEAVE